MKKIICILLMISVIFSLSACNVQTEDKGGDKEETTAPYSEKIVREKKLYKEFVAADGTLAYVVDIIIPEVFGGVTEGQAAMINQHYVGMYNQAVKMAELNVENAAQFMKNLGTEKPWTKTVRYEILSCDEKFLCLLVSDSPPLSGEPIVSADCISLENGNEYILNDFKIDKEMPLSDSARRNIIFEIQSLVEKELFRELSSAQLEALEKAFDEENFYFDKEYVYFYVYKGDIDPVMVNSGIYVVRLPWSDFSDELQSPYIHEPYTTE